MSLDTKTAAAAAATMPPRSPPLQPSTSPPDSAPNASLAPSNSAAVNNAGQNPDLPQSKFGMGSDHADIVVFIVKFFRIVSIASFVWLVGYMHLSVAWILVATYLYLLREKANLGRELKAKMIQAIGINEKNAILARVDEVPSWVYFPDKERVEWMNKIMKQIWPYLRVYMAKTITEVVEPILNQYTTSIIDKIKFDELDLGDMPPRIGSVKVYTENIPTSEIMMDLEILYAGDAQIKVLAKKIKAGIKDIQFQGNARIILKPLCNRIPFFASMTFFFLEMPQIDFNLTNIANTFDLPGIRKLIHNTVSDAVSKVLVLPNRLVVPILPDFNISTFDSFKTLRPRGILRLTVIKATNLKNADIGFFGKSDPYVRISGVGTSLKTRVISNNLNPAWNETFHLLIDKVNPNPNLMIEVFDKDDLNDDFLGGISVEVDSLVQKGKEEGMYKLKSVKHGELFLRFEWFYLSSQYETLQQIRANKAYTIQQPTSVLVIGLYGASDLPHSQKKSSGLTEPYPKVHFVFKDEKKTSSSKPRTTNPEWNENFYFYVENPEVEQLSCQVEDEKTGEVIATLNVVVATLFYEAHMSIDRYFDLNTMQSGYMPKIHMTVALKILSEKEDNQIDDEDQIEDQSRAEISETTNSKSAPSAMNLTNASDRANSVDNISLHCLSVDKDSMGRIRLSLKYSIDSGVFVIIIHECKNLRPVHHAHLPDPYVKIGFRNDKKFKKKTKSVKDTLNPVFDERLQFNITHGQLTRNALVVTVKNDKFFLTTEAVFMGQVIFDLSKIKLDNAIENKWFDLKEKQDSMFFLE